MEIREIARKLRRDLTDAERVLWLRLRSRQMMGFKFRRQVPIGNYVVDFACLEKRLIIEVDGSQHLDREDYDSGRTRWLEHQGFRVFRFWNNQILDEIEGVLQTIGMALEEDSTPHPNPPPQGGRELPPSSYSKSKDALNRLP